MWLSVPHTLWSSEVDSWWTADHNKLNKTSGSILCHWSWLSQNLGQIETWQNILQRFIWRWAAIENLYIKITNEYKIWVERGFIFLNSCLKTRWIVEGGLYNVQRQKKLLLPLCCGNSMLSRPINVTLYDKSSLMCKNTPPPCLFLSNLRRQLLR